MPISQDSEEMEHDVKTASDVADLKILQGGVLDENDPDNARFMVLIRSAMEDLQRQVETERSLYHKSRDELSLAESQSRNLETELNMEKERNFQLMQELERLEQFMSKRNENGNNINSEEADNYWELYKEALNRIDELESSIQNDKRLDELELRKTQLENELGSYKDVISEYKSDNQKLINEIKSLKEARDLNDRNFQSVRKEYDDRIQDLSEKLSIEMLEHESILEQYTEAKKSLSDMNRTLKSNKYSSLEELIGAVKIKNNEIESWKARFNDLEASVGVTNEREIELHEREISVVSKEGYLNGKEASLSHLEEKLKLQEQSLNDKAKELDKRSLSVSNLEKEIMEKQREFESYVDDLNLREQSFNKMVEDYSANMEKVQSEHVSDYKKKTAEIEIAKLELENGKIEYEKLRMEVEKSRSDVESERKSVDKIKYELEQELNGVKAGKAETEKLRAELELQRSELDRQEVELRSKQLDLGEKQKSLSTLKEELISLEKILAAKSKKMEEDERQMHVQLEHAKSDNLRKLSMQYESQLRALEKELEESRNALREERESQSARKSQIVALQESRLRDIEERERSVSELESILNSQKEDLESKQKEFDVYINELESRQKEFEEFWFELDKRQKSISAREKELDSREALMSTQRAALSESERKSLEEREGHLYEREARLKDKESKLIERENRLVEKENRLIERENRLVEKEKGLLEREMGLNDLEREINGLGQKAKLVEESLLAREVKVEERESVSRTKESALGRREAILDERECSVDRRETDLRDRDQELKDRERELDERERQLQLERKPLLDELIRIEERDKQLFERELAIQRSEDLLQEMEGVIKTREKELYEGKHSSSKDKEICELRQMIEDLELRNRDIERETQKTCRVLQQQIQEEMKQKEELLYTILHLHKQINSIGTSLGYGSSDGVGPHDGSRGGDLRQNHTNSQSSAVGGGGELNKDSSSAANETGRAETVSEVSRRNGDVISSLEKTMKKLYEKLQATESREKNLLKELRQFTERSRSYRTRAGSVSPFIRGTEESEAAGGAAYDSSGLPAYPSEAQELSDLPKPLEGRVPAPLRASKELAGTSKRKILPTMTNNSPAMYPESPMVLMPLLTDIKNELNELKKSNESSMNRTTQTEEKFAGGISRVGERSGVAGMSFSQPANVSGVASASSSQVYDNGLGMDYCIPSGYCSNLSNNSLPASSNMNPPVPGSLMSNTSLQYPSVSSSMMGGGGGVHDQASKIVSILQSLRPSSGSAASSSVVPSKDVARKLLEQELHSLRQWKKGMKQWDSELSASSHSKQEEAAAWKQFLDQQMQVIAKKLERRISAALQK